MVATNFSLGKPGHPRPSGGGVQPATLEQSAKEPPLIRPPTRTTGEQNFAPVYSSVGIFDDTGSLKTHGQANTAGVGGMFSYLKKDPQAAAMVEFASVIIKDPVEVIGFRPIGECEPPVFGYASSTPLWEALGKGIDLFYEQQKKCQQTGRPFHKSILIAITDWRAGDKPGDVLERIHAAENDRGLQLSFFPVVAGEDPDLELANRVSSKRQAAVLKGLNYESMFIWFSQVIKGHVKSRRTDVVKHEATDGWRQS